LLFPIKPVWKKEKPTNFSLVDVGRSLVKALVVQTAPELQIVGCGLTETGGHDITGGRIEAAGVLAPVNAALTQAEDSTEAATGQKIVPDEVIFALPGRATLGKLFTVQQARSKPTQPVTTKELEQLRLRAERLVRQGLTNLPDESGQWQLLAVTDAGLRLDEFQVLSGVGLTGATISFSLFGVAGYAGAMRALEVLANRLDLHIANLVAAPQALATITPAPEAIILDTGLAGTDAYLIRNNALVAAGWTPFGGGFFSRALARVLEVEPAEAEPLKLGFATETLPPEQMRQVNAGLKMPRQRWYEAVVELLGELSPGMPLPRRIYLVGRGNLLPGLEKLLRTNPAPFDGVPKIARLGERPLPIKNLAGPLDYNNFALALSLTAGLPE
jgi:cell division ATPase FtsA